MDTVYIIVAAVGALLVVFGLFWILIMRATDQRPPRGLDVTAEEPWYVKVAEWLWNKAKGIFNKREMPGVFFLIIGFILLAASLGVGLSQDDDGSGTPTPTTTTAP